jgi:ABC-type branched-subunit amino acid transport system substrate-binding protein
MLTPEQALYAQRGAGSGVTADGSVAGATGAPAAPGDAAANNPAQASGDSSTRAPGGDVGARGSGVGAPAANCQGLQNGTGITGDTVTIANASDISGPVPGLFQSAQQATKAFAAYFNSTQNICGRKLQVLALDSRTDTGGDQQAATQACQQAFAMVGSMSAFDQGGAKTVSDCGIPDLRSSTVTTERQKSPVVFGTDSVRINLIPASVPDYFRATYPDAASKAAFLWINGASAQINAQSEIAGWQKRGFNFVYQQAVDVTEFNYSPYVVQMKQKGVRYVQFVGAHQNAVQLAHAMQQQGFKPDAFVLDPTGYDANYVKSGGAAVDGTKVWINSALFEEAGSNPEMQLYLKWLQQVAPGATPSYFGLFGWAAARLFTEQALALGGKLNRQSMITALANVHGWDGHGLFAPQDVGGRRTANCDAIIKLQGDKWVRESNGKFLCGDLVDTGVGG